MSRSAQLPSMADPPFAAAPDYGKDSVGRRRARAPEFTPDQMKRITEYYAQTPALEFDLAVLAHELSKSRHNICRFARRTGITNRSRPLNAKQMAAVRKPKWAKRQHPRGMAGKKHSAETKATISEKSKLMWATQRTFGGPLVSDKERQRRSEQMKRMQSLRPAEANYSNRKGGHRADLGGQYFRSSWEANYARYLNFLMKLGAVESWKYEPVTFWFEGIKRGVTNYRPDFCVRFRGESADVFIEIKGWEVPKDRTKWRRMKKYHPEIVLQIVRAKEYYDIQKKWASCIPEWERPSPKSAGSKLISWPPAC